jgi:hypothetical protein
MILRKPFARAEQAALDGGPKNVQGPILGGLVPLRGGGDERC